MSKKALQPLFLICLFLFLSFQPRLYAEGSKTLIVIASTDFDDSIELTSKLYVEHYRTMFKESKSVTIKKVDLSANVPYSSFGGQGSKDNIFGKVVSEDYDRVIYIVDAHGETSGGHLELSLDQRTRVELKAGSAFFNQIYAHSPNAVKRDLVLFSCHAGALPDGAFKGDVYGASSKKEETFGQDLIIFRTAMEDHVIPTPTSAAEFYSEWQKFRGSKKYFEYEKKLFNSKSKPSEIPAGWFASTTFPSVCTPRLSKLRKPPKPL